MKSYLLSSCMILASAFAFSQGQKVSTVSFALLNGEPASAAAYTTLDQQPAVAIVVPYAPSTVLGAMNEYEARSYGSKKLQSDAYQSFDKTALMQKNKKG